MENVILKEISDTLKRNFNISEIILFGSFQKGIQNSDSDIDLLVILNENGIAKNYDERLDRKVKMYGYLHDFIKKIPIDLIVFTKKEWELVLSYDSSFYNEINKEGLRIN